MRAYRSRAASSGDDVVRTSALGVVLGVGGTGWLVLLHHVEGAHEHGEPSVALHVLRDAALALPAVVVAVMVSAVAARRLIRACGFVPGGGAAAATHAMAAGLGAGIALGAGIPVHGWLFKAHEEQGVSLLQHVIGDGG